MAESAVAPMHASAMSTFPVVHPDNPMNHYCLDQARQHAQRNPYDSQAQAMYMHWLHSIQHIERIRQQQMGAQSVYQPVGPTTTAAVPTVVPSNLTGAPHAPTPPLSATHVQGPTGAPQSRSERQVQSTPVVSQWHTPTPTRASTPRRARDEMQRDLHDARRRANSARARQRTRSADDHEDDRYQDKLGLGTRIISAETTLRKHAEGLAKQDSRLHQADAMLESPRQRIVKAEQII